MRIRALAVFIATVAVVLAGCSTSGGSGGTLEGTTWILKSYDDGSSVVSLPQGVYPDAVFAGGKVTGMLACNSYTGAYTQSGSSLTITGLASTLMACPGTSAGIEQGMLTAMGRAATYTASTASLKIYDSSGKEILVYQAGKPDALEGATWVATSMNNGNGGFESVAGGTTITALFGTDGQVSGSGGCNDYSGTYTAADGTIAIGPLAATQKACDPAVNTQESAYFAALGKATVYTIKGATLELRDTSGALQASYTKQ